MAEATVRYEVLCYKCSNRFDAMEAGSCGCINKERTLVCPNCLSCFCDAPRPYRQKFWESAPQELWSRKLKEKKDAGAEAGAFVNPPVDELARPAVLVVDDEPGIRAVAMQAVRALGYGLIAAADGQEGLELALRYAPELVLTDAFMPRIDGREMCLRIKTDPSLKGTRVVIMTSLYTSAQQKHEALKDFKVDDYVTKPLDFRKLQSVLQRLLG